MLVQWMSIVGTLVGTLAGTLLVLLASATAATAQQVRVEDDAGNPLVLAQPAQRIISLAPHITELLYAAGAGKRIVGVVDYSDFPAAAKKIERIGNYSAIDLERIVVLKPDLIIAWHSGNPKPAMRKLEQLGIPVFYSDPHTMQDIASSIMRFGVLAGTQPAARKAAQGFQRQLRQLTTRYAGRSTVTVFYEIWNQPMTTVNGQHLISEVIKICGGHNVFAGLASLAPTVAVEPVLAANPQVIIASSNDGKMPGWLLDWKRWSTLDAVRYDNLYYINWDYINRLSPRILKGVQGVCEALDSARDHLRQQVH